MIRLSGPPPTLPPNGNGLTFAPGERPPAPPCGCGWWVCIMFMHMHTCMHMLT